MQKQQGYKSWRGHGGTGPTVVNISVTYAKFFDWKSVFLMQEML